MASSSSSASGSPSLAAGVLRVGFVGGGRMAQAIAAGLRSSPSTSAWKIGYFDPSRAAGEAFEQRVPGAVAHHSNQEVCSHSDVVVLAIKPQLVPQILGTLKTDVAGKLVVSIIAGLTLAKLQEALGTNRIVRTMPNTPALVGAGATAYAMGGGCEAKDRETVPQILNAVGWSIEVPESMIDAVTGVSGSGPAYVMLMIEGLADGGVRMGLPRDIAQQLAIRTLLGSAQLAAQTETHPAILREQVTSPGGTTAAGLAALEKGAVRFHLMAAVEAACCRAKELGSH